MNESYKAGFNKIREIIDFPDFDKPFETIDKEGYNYATEEYDGDFNSPYNLCNSSSKASFLLLHIYSMEPPFYFHLNTACRNKDADLLPMLGPFADALFYVVADAEDEREDKLETGVDFEDNHPLGTFCRSFLVFRGASLKAKAILNYQV